MVLLWVFTYDFTVGPLACRSSAILDGMELISQIVSSEKCLVPDCGPRRSAWPETDITWSV
jgi:hypothetical protein